MGTRLVYDVADAPVWLTRADGSDKFSGTPEPGHYDFVISAYVVENDISSQVSSERVSGTIPFQEPIWQTPATQDAVFTNVAGNVQLLATSYAARMRYQVFGPEVPGASVDATSGILTYEFSQQGRHAIPVDAVAYAKSGAQVVTDGIPKPRDTEGICDVVARGSGYAAGRGHHQ